MQSIPNYRGERALSDRIRYLPAPRIFIISWSPQPPWLYTTSAGVRCCEVTRELRCGC